MTRIIDHCKYANSALAEYTSNTGSDPSTAVTDLLADLMHLCDQREDLESFSCALERARYHYGWEREEEERVGGEQ